MPKGLSPRVFYRKFARITHKNWMREHFVRRQHKRLDQTFGPNRPPQPNPFLCLMS